MEQLTQDYIDSIIGFGTPLQPLATPKSKEQPTYRTYQQSYPIQYMNSTTPDYYAVRTITEKWNEDARKWEYYDQFEKMYYPDGRAVN
jgi:hypothetical protein